MIGKLPLAAIFAGVMGVALWCVVSGQYNPAGQHAGAFIVGASIGCALACYFARPKK